MLLVGDEVGADAAQRLWLDSDFVMRADISCAETPSDASFSFGVLPPRGFRSDHPRPGGLTSPMWIGVRASSVHIL